MRVTPQGGGQKEGPRQVPRSPPPKHATSYRYGESDVVRINDDFVTLTVVVA